MIIGPSKYSKDPSIMPDGIALTLPKIFFEERGMTFLEFKEFFEETMNEENNYWNFRLKNLPTIEVPYVYILFGGHFHYRCNFMQYERNKSKIFNDTPDGIVREFAPTNWVLFTGPVIKAPPDFVQKGFQGFRYTTQIF